MEDETLLTIEHKASHLMLRVGTDAPPEYPVSVEMWNQDDLPKSMLVMSLSDAERVKLIRALGGVPA